MKNADLIIIGGGPAGYETALLAAKKGLQTTLIESRWLGGTCLNEGCIPTKCLCHSAEIMEVLDNNAATFEFTIPKVMQRKNQVVETLKAGVDSMLKAAKVEVVYGNATFKDAHVVEVENAKDAEGNEVDKEYSAKNVMIATGSVTKFLPIEGAHLPGVLTSRELLNIADAPESICIIGGGVIGLEFASIFTNFGSKVSIVEFCPEILPNFDRDIAKRLRTTLKKKGIEFYVNSAVTGIGGKEGDFVVNFTTKGVEKQVNASTVLMATGRKANTENLNLEGVGIATGKRGIEVDENFETSAKGVYAIGDVNGLVQLAHVAKFQGRKALAHILGETENVDFNIIPAAVFTAPELAMVGLTEEDCKNRNIEYKSHKAFYRANGKALSMGESDGLVKILSTPDGKILGAHIMGAHSSDLIHELAMVMNFSGTLADVSRMIHSHPTLSELILDAAEN